MWRNKTLTQKWSKGIRSQKKASTIRLKKWLDAPHSLFKATARRVTMKAIKSFMKWIDEEIGFSKIELNLEPGDID